MKKLILLLLLTSTPLFGTINLSQFTLTEGITETTLPNGLKIIIKPDLSSPLAGIALTYDVGFRNEQKGQSGWTHLLEHMMFQGTATRGKGEIARRLTELGARFNAFTSYEVTCYWAVLPPAALEEAAAIEADRMQNSLFVSNEFEREKRVVQSEISKHETDPDVRLMRAAAPVLFGEHPYGKMFGTLEDLASATRDRLVEDIYRTYYVPDNATLIVTGQINASDTLKTMTRIFSPLPRGTKPRPAVSPIPGFSSTNIAASGPARESFGYSLFNMPGRSLQNKDYQALSLLAETGLLGSLYFDESRDGTIGMVGYTTTPEIPADQITLEYLKENLTREKSRYFQKERLRYSSCQDTLMGLVGLEHNYGWKNYHKRLQLLDNLTAPELHQTVKKYLHAANSSSLYYTATGQGGLPEGTDARLTTDQFSAPDRKASLDKPDQTSIDQARANLKTAGQSIQLTLNQYLSNVDVWKLPNGVTVVHKPMAATQNATIILSLQGGKLIQKSPLQAEWTRNLIFGGGPQILLLNDLKSQGGRISTSVDEDFTIVTLNIAYDSLPLAVRMLQISLENRSFYPEVLRQWRRDALKQLKEDLKDNDPASRAGKVLARNLWGQAGPGLDETDQSALLLTTGLDQCREYYQAVYRPENATITFCGNWKKAEVEKALNATLTRWTAPPLPGPTPVKARPNQPSGQPLSLVKLPVLQSVILLSGPAITYNHYTNYVASLLMQQIFGGGLDSRLIRSLRDKAGLTYGVFTWLTPAGPDSIYNVYLQTAPRDINRALQLYQSELKRFKNDGPNELELAMYQTSYLYRLLFNYSSPETIARALTAAQTRRGNARLDQVTAALVQDIPAEAIRTALRDAFPENVFGAAASQ